MSVFSGDSSFMLPATLDDVRPLLLTEALRSSGLLSSASVKNIQVVNRYTGMTSQIGRIQLEYDRDVPEAPRTVIIKLPSPDEKTRQYFSSWGYYEREVQFYSILDGKMTFRMPHCYASAYDTSTGMSLLVLEDLEGLDNQVTYENCSAERAEIVTRVLAKFHAAWWGQPALEEFDWVYRPSNSVNQSMVETALRNWERFCLAVGDHRTTVMDAITGHVAVFPQIKARWMNRPPFTMNHGDFQFPNLFFDPLQPEAEPVVTDFQFVSRSCGPANDLAFFICTCLDTPIRKACETHLLDLYYSFLPRQAIADYPFSLFMQDYRFGIFNCMMRLATLVGEGYIKDQDVLLARFRRTSTIFEDNQAWKVLDEAL